MSDHNTPQSSTQPAADPASAQSVSAEALPVELALLAQRAIEPIELPSPRSIEDIPTPALLLDEAVLDANIALMAKRLQAQGKRPRPHAKTHKCPLISRRQMAAGAVGICTAKLSEAFVQARSGVTDILVTSPITTVDRIAGIVATRTLAPDLKLVVDTPLGLSILQAAAEQLQVPLGVVLDVDVEMGRTGNRNVAEIIQLAEQITSHPYLELKGMQHYAGHLQHVEDATKRQERSLSSWGRALEIAASLREAGFELGIITGAGTGTFDIDASIEELTDLQVGSYVFMDAEYRKVAGLDGAESLPFAVSLTLQASVISQPMSGAVTLDCGFKSMASETIAPEFIDLAGAKFRFAGDEQAVALLPEGTQQPLLGEKLSLVTPHCDPTVNLYDYYWVHREGYAHSLWPITGRGCAW